MKIFTTNNLRRLFLLTAVVIMAVGNAWGYAKSTLTITSTSGGEVSVSLTQNSGQYRSSDSKSQETGGFTTTSATHTYYVFVKPNSGYKCVGVSGNDLKVTSLTSDCYKIELTAGTRTADKKFSGTATFKSLYEVVFHANGGSGSMLNQSFVYDQAQKLSSNTFTNHYTVTYNANGGTCSPASATANRAFSGWATSSDGSVAYDNQQSVINLTETANGSFNLYAIWGDADSVKLLTPTKSDGSQFEGWYDGKSRVGLAGESYTPTKDVTLTAKWVSKYELEMSGSDYSLMVDNTQNNAFSFVRAENPVAHIQVSSISPINDGSGKVIEYDAANNCIIARNAGVATINFSQAETSTMKESTSSTWTITVSKRSNPITITMDGVQRNEVTINRGEKTNVTWSSASKSEFVIAGGNEVVTCDDNTFSSNYRNGSATWTVSQTENYKYLAGNTNFTINVVDAPEADCYVLNESAEWAGNYSDYKDYTLNGPGNVLTMDIWRTYAATYGLYVIQYVGSTEVKRIEYNNASMDDKVQHKTITLENGVTKIRVQSTGGTLDKHCSNVLVTRKTFLTTSVDELALPSKTISGDATTATFNINWSSSNGGNIHIVSDNPLFTVSPSVIENTSCNSGVTQVTVTYNSSEAGTHNGTLHIYDAIRQTTVNLTGSTQSKLATHIVWNGKKDYNYSEADGIQNNPFKVFDANEDEVEGAVVTYTSSNPYIAEVSSDGTYRFTPYCGGDVTLTATYAGSESYQGCPASQTIHVALCEPTLVWNQVFNTYSSDDIGTHVALIASITEKDGSNFAGVSYTYDTENHIVASVSEQELILNASGSTQLTLTTNEVVGKNDRRFEAVHASRQVNIRNQGEPCVTYLLNHSETIFAGGYAPTTTLPIDDGPLGTLTYKVWRRPAATKDAKMQILDANYVQLDFRNYAAVSLNGDESNALRETIDLRTEQLKNAKYIRFEGDGTLAKFFGEVCVTMDSYLKTSYAGQEDVAAQTVNTPFDRTAIISYSAKPALTLSVTAEEGNEAPLLSASFERVVDNDCDNYGTYTLSIHGLWTKQQHVRQIVHIKTSANDDLQIPINLDVIMGPAWHFETETGFWNDNAKWTVAGIHQTLDLPNASNEVYINKDIKITGKVEAYLIHLTNGAKIEIMPGAGLTLGAGGIAGATKENLILHADAEHGTAYLRISPEYSGAMPQATVEMYTKAYYDEENTTSMKDAKWQYIGFPLQRDAEAPLVSDIFSGSWIQSWAPGTQSWGAISSTAKVAPFYGFICTQSEDSNGKIFKHKGTLVRQDASAVRTMSNSSKSDEKYYVFANSYSAPIDLAHMNRDVVFSGDIERTIYIYNTGSYNDWQSTVTRDGNSRGQYTAIPAGNASEMAKMTGKSVYIPSMQGFMMVCPAEKSGSFTFDYESMIWKANYSSLEDGLPMHAPARTSQMDDDTTSVRMMVRLACGDVVSDMYTIERQGFSSAFDNGYDARYMSGDVSLGIYANVSGTKYSFHSTDSVIGTYLGLNAGTDLLHTLSFPYVETVEPLYLQDLANDSIIEVEQGTAYSFTADSASDNSLRFRLLNADMLPADYWTGNGDNGGSEIITPVVPEEPIVTALNSTTATTALWVSDGSLYATANGASAIVLYDLNGRMIMSRAFRNAGSLSLENLPAGVYMAHSGSHLLKIVR